MNRRLELTVVGTPVPQGSKTFVPTAAGGRAKESNEKALKPWRASVAAAALDAMGELEPLVGPLELRAIFVFPRPKAHFGTGRNAGRLKPSAPSIVSTKPDLDKLVRAVGDALTGIVYRDDSQLAIVHAEKHYGTPCAHLVVYSWED